MATTNIGWTNKVWNPIVGCSRVSRGCERCYAERLAFRLSAMGQARYQGLTKKVGDEIRWTGEVRFVPEALNLPLRWKRPCRVFVNSMSDLFHEGVPDGWIDRIFAVMALAPQHTFQVLTKRPERAREYLADMRGMLGRVFREAVGIGKLDGAIVASRLDDPRPLDNVHLGVSVEDQATADERIPLLLQAPAAVRWVSYEPALGPVTFLGHLMSGERPAACVCGHGHGFTRCPNTGGVAAKCHRDGCPCPGFQRISGHGLDWIVVGGESGPNRRPFDLAWLESAVAQCDAAGIPIYVKQGSALRPGQQANVPDRLWRHEFPKGVGR